MLSLSVGKFLLEGGSEEGISKLQAAFQNNAVVKAEVCALRALCTYYYESPGPEKFLSQGTRLVGHR